MSADRRAWIFEVMKCEGYVNALFEEAAEGTEPGTELWIAEVELDLWDDED